MLKLISSEELVNEESKMMDITMLYSDYCFYVSIILVFLETILIVGFRTYNINPTMKPYFSTHYLEKHVSTNALGIDAARPSKSKK